jgi:hypothetical protein
MTGNISRLNYGDNEEEQWIIAPEHDGKFNFSDILINLTFSTFHTEECCDYVETYQCTDMNCSTKILLQKIYGDPKNVITVSSVGAMLITWYSDEYVTSTGWAATWTASAGTG